MSKRFQNLNRYRNAVCTPAKRENWLQELQLSTQYSDASNGIKVGTQHYLVKCGEAGSGRLNLVGLGHPEHGGECSRELMNQSGGTLVDWDLSWFSHPVTAAGITDAGGVQVWSLGGNELEAGDNKLGAVAPMVSFQGHQRRGEAVFFHPTCREILTTFAVDGMRLWDINQVATNGAPLAELPSAYADKKVASGCWKDDGTTLLWTTKAGTVHQWDPRSHKPESISENVTGHSGLKPSRILALDGKPLFVTTGFSRMRERQLALWDYRRTDNPLTTLTMDSSTGILMPLYDGDTETLYTIGKGDTTIRWYSVNTTQAQPLVELGSAPTSVQCVGAALVPKVSLDVMQCEIARVGLLAKPLMGTPTPAIVPLSFHVPRRTHREFSPELFPDTKGHHTTLTPKAWLDGDVQPVEKVSLDPAKQTTRVSPPPVAPEVTSPSVEQEVTPSLEKSPEKPIQAMAPTKKESEPSPVPAAPVQPVKSATKTPSPLTQKAVSTPSLTPKPKVLMKQGPPCKYLEGRVYHPSQHFTHVPPANESLPADIELLAFNSDFLAYPAQGPGGPITVLPRTRPGRCPVNSEAPVFTTGTPVVMLYFAPFEPRRLVTFHNDRTVRFWQLPESGVTKNTILEPTTTLVVPGDKIIAASPHPLAKGIWAVAVSESPALHHVLIYHETELLTKIAATNEGIHHLAWSRSGSLLAVATRKKHIQVYNVYTGEMVQEGKSHDSIRVCKIFWTGDDQYMGSVGFGAGSQREILLFKVDKLPSGPVYRQFIDVSPGVLHPHYDPDLEVLYLADKGSSHILCYEWFDDTLHELPRFESGQSYASVAFAPKPLCQVAKAEVQRAYGLTVHHVVESIGFYVPRKRMEYFQDDLYPPTSDPTTPAISGSDWWQQQPTQLPNLPKVDLHPEGMTKLSDAPPVEVKRTAHTVQEEMVSEEVRRQGFIDTMLSKARLVAEASEDSDDAETYQRVNGTGAHQNSDQEVSDSEWND
ncbi:hypothetical protein IWQ62_003520 [Dispira parvispora]|uniref:DUF1899 domain-containing protein n=1 Tax=Dispira parvispora TaxID=1520584 RepID=A0A9W8ANB5_9FUNG|nr:hypothetical protein IWQ62_003520 [Dispira parvispora]